MCLACAASGDAASHGFFVAEASIPVRDIAPTGTRLLDSLLHGTAWDGPELDFAFATSAEAYGDAYQDDPSIQLSGFAPFSAAMADVARMLLTGQGTGFRSLGVADFTALRFAETDAQDATLRFGFALLPGAFGIVGGFPGPGAAAGDVFLGSGQPFPEPVWGEFTTAVLTHEIGHALGLKHPFDGTPLMPAAFDGMTWTVMAYAPAPLVNLPDAPLASGDIWPRSWMLLDIQALQHLYGANWDFRAGDTVYRWDAATGEMLVDGVGQGIAGDPDAPHVLQAIWDGGGRDTYDFRGFNGVRASLAAGGWTTLSDAMLAEVNPAAFGDAPPVFAPGNIANALLPGGDRRALVEDAIGSAGADIIVGNVLGNRLVGGAGADRLDGGGGADTLAGGLGADTLVGGSGIDTVTFGGSRVAVDLAAPGLNRGEALGDVFIGIERFVLTAGDDHFADGPGEVRVLAGAGADTLVGGGGGVHFDGGAGVDILRFRDEAAPVVIDLLETAAGGFVALRIEEFRLGDGDDVFRGGVRRDRLDGGGGNDTLVGRAGNDILDGNLDDDLLQGGEGADSLFGSNGSDVLEGGAGADTLDGGRGADRLDGGEGIDTATFAGMLVFDPVAFIGVVIDLDAPGDNRGEALGDTYAGIERFVLTDLNDDFHGDDAAQIVLGGGGDDWIVGRGGRDTLSGGGGSDGFAFAGAREGRDLITDFTLAEDELDWIAINAPGFGGGLVADMDLAAEGRLVAGIAPVATRAVGQFLYDTTTGLLSWDVDGTGRAAPVGFALLAGAPLLTAADILVS